MTPGQIELIIKRSLLHERTYRQIEAHENVIYADLDFLFQMMMGDAALVFPDANHVAEFDKSEYVLEYVNTLCAHADAKTAKSFIINLGRLGFDNLHYNLVCKWHPVFSKFEIARLQQEAQNLMTLIR